MKSFYLFAALLVVAVSKPLINGGNNCDGGDEGEPPLSTNHIVGKAQRHGSGKLHLALQTEHIRGKAHKVSAGVFCGGDYGGEGEPPRYLEANCMAASAHRHGAGRVQMRTKHARADVHRVSAAVFCNGGDDGEFN